jgi:predicted NAD/FAD-binding protein
MEFVMDFLANHQMLQVADRPVWRVLKGGSRSYVDKIVHLLGKRLRLNAAVEKVTRGKDGVEIAFPDGTMQSFDEVILACHADQALRLIASPCRDEVALLESFPYEKNMVSLHSDDSLLPRRKSARASWNAYLSKQSKSQSVVTYDMNILQSLPTDEPFCVSLNQRNEIRESALHGEFEFSHPTFHSGRKDAQRRHDDFIRRRGISLCGAYWGYGFHEDGLKSGLRVCKAFGASL